MKTQSIGIFECLTREPEWPQCEDIKVARGYRILAELGNPYCPFCEQEMKFQDEVAGVITPQETYGLHKMWVYGFAAFICGFILGQIVNTFLR